MPKLFWSILKYCSGFYSNSFLCTGILINVVLFMWTSIKLFWQSLRRRPPPSPPLVGMSTQYDDIKVIGKLNGHAIGIITIRWIGDMISKRVGNSVITPYCHVKSDVLRSPAKNQESRIRVSRRKLMLTFAPQQQLPRTNTALEKKGRLMI